MGVVMLAAPLRMDQVLVGIVPSLDISANWKALAVDC
jgi:hypothetical protein